MGASDDCVATTLFTYHLCTTFPHLLRQMYILHLLKLLCLRHQVAVIMAYVFWLEVSYFWVQVFWGINRNDSELSPYDEMTTPGIQNHSCILIFKSNFPALYIWLTTNILYHKYCHKVNSYVIPVIDKNYFLFYLQLLQYLSL